ncbi:hypothetical protein FWH58_02380 [Candidatus Saccharibacteria bacterium]|nr:hypothetical protein [Candidatus Saccharibacteria bacterium]
MKNDKVLDKNLGAKLNLIPGSEQLDVEASYNKFSQLPYMIAKRQQPASINLKSETAAHWSRDSTRTM